MRKMGGLVSRYPKWIESGLTLGVVLLAFGGLYSQTWASGHGESAPAAHAEPAHAVEATESHPEAAPTVVEAQWHIVYPNWMKHNFVTHAWRRFAAKVDHLRKLDEASEVLAQRVANLELQNAGLAQTIAERREAERAAAIRSVARAEGGVEVSRTIASIEAPAAELLAMKPVEIYGAALKSFNAGEYEHATKVFAHLLDDKENGTYQEARTYFLAGIAAYKISNFKTALGWFEQARAKAIGESVSFAPRALAWEALCHSKLGNKKAEAKVMRELIDQYPKSKEARRFNGNA
jgi:TolA-binding protein